MESAAQRRSGPLGFWTGLPLYARIAIGLALGIVVGLALGPAAKAFDWPARLILRVLGALAPVLILVAVSRAILTADIHGALALRMGGLLLQNTLTAILIGLGVANLVRPGVGARLEPPATMPRVKGDVVAQLLDNVPDSLLRPFVDNKVIGVVMIAVAFGLAARQLGPAQKKLAEELSSLGFSCILTILSWVIALVPLAVFGKVASIVGTSGFSAFRALGWFVLSVLLALSLQAVYYLVRIRLGSWAGPRSSM